jgi:hypothetical protein
MTEDEIRAEFEHLKSGTYFWFMMEREAGVVEYKYAEIQAAWADYLSGAQMAIKKMTKREGVE